MFYPFIVELKDGTKLILRQTGHDPVQWEVGCSDRYGMHAVRTYHNKAIAQLQFMEKLEKESDLGNLPEVYHAVL